MSLARHFAERITALKYEDLPPEAVYWSKVAVLDTLGVMLAGSCEEPPHIVEEVLGLSGKGDCLIVGSDRRAGPLDAALINGTAAHVLDFDNTAAHMGGHVSAVMVPALLAAAEAFDVSGRDLLLGHTVGYEVGARIGQAVNFYHTELGWHPTWTVGVFAVTAACARMLNLTTEQTETALAMATSLSGGTKANFGTMTKSLHAGSCARNGLQAVLLARKGFTANPNAFEHKQGFFNVFNGKGNYDVAKAVAHWADPLDIVAPGASYKLYPCCYSTHAAIEAALNIVKQHGTLDPQQIARVESHTADVRLLHTDRPDPNSELDAKFSVQYCVLRALIDGKVVMEHFENEAYREAVIRETLPRVQAIPAGHVLRQGRPVQRAGQSHADRRTHAGILSGLSARPYLGQSDRARRSAGQIRKLRRPRVAGENRQGGRAMRGRHGVAEKRARSDEHGGAVQTGADPPFRITLNTEN